MHVFTFLGANNEKTEEVREANANVNKEENCFDNNPSSPCSIRTYFQQGLTAKVTKNDHPCHDKIFADGDTTRILNRVSYECARWQGSFCRR